MGLIKTYEELTSLLKEGSMLDVETINLIVKTLTSSATPKGETAVEAFQSFVFESMVYAMTRRDLFEKDRKKIVYALCNLNNLTWTMDAKDEKDASSSQQSFISKIMDFLLNMMYSEEKNIITLGIEMLIPAYIMRLSPEDMSKYVEKLCNPVSHAQSIGKSFNIYAAAAVTHCVVELHSLHPSTISDHLSSLVKTLLDTLEHLVSKKDYESIPPLVYQLFGLTKALSNDDCVKVLRGIASLLETLHRYHSTESGNSAGTGKDDIAHWTISTSLSHLGTTVRNNPALSPVLLDLIKGKYSSTLDNTPEERHGLRYETITPIILAMGITLSSAVPRMKRGVLEAIRDLVLEEEMVRAKRFSSKWVNCNMALLVKGSAFLDSSGNIRDDVNVQSIWNDIHEYQRERLDSDITEKSLVMKCIKDLVLLADSGKDQARGGGGEFSSLYPTLESIGFLLIDSVKKDVADDFHGPFHTLSVPTCATHAYRNSMGVAQQKAKLNTAQIGRSLLVFLFTRAGTEDNETRLDGLSGGSAASHPLCRSIIQNSSSRFCGMALNALEHSRLLLDLVNYDSNEKSITSTRSYGTGAHMLEDSFLPMIIDLLANIQGGSISPSVVVKCIIPTLRVLLTLCAKLSIRSRRKRNEFNDHIDHLFLLSKKVLFCTDIDRRKVAVNLLVLLIEISKIHPDESMRDSLVDEVTGYLKRCITQHQTQVRTEAYAALVSILERNPPNMFDPASDSPSNDQRVIDKDSVVQVEVVISHLLCSHVERYIVIDEDASVLEARRKRAIQHGTHLSQIDIDDDENERGNSLNSPLRLDLCTAVLRSSISEGHQLNDKLSKKGKNSTDTLTTAVNSISEPFPFLLMALIASLRCDDKFDPNSPEYSSVFQVLFTLQSRMAESSLDSYLVKIVGHDRDSFDSISEPDAIKMLAICLLVASTSEVLMSLPSTPSNYNWDTINRLFNLRTSAVFKAAALLASIKTYSTAKKKKTKKKNDEIETEVKNKEGIHIVESSSEKSRDALEKYRLIIEDTVSKIAPSPMISFIEHSLEKIGILSQPNGAIDPLNITQDEENMEEEFSRSLLSRNVLFRRFLLFKSANALDGSSTIITAGLRIQSSMDQSYPIHHTYSTFAFRLGPLLLCEFFSHIRNSKFTSLLEQTDTPLSQVALRGILSATQILRSIKEPSELSQFLDTSWKKVFVQFPDSKQLWEESTKDAAHADKIPSNEKCLYNSIYPFFAPPKDDRVGIIGELINHGLDEEATLCCHLIKVCLIDASPAIRTPSLFALDQTLAEGKNENYNGILRLDYDNRLSCQKLAVTVLDSLILFDDLLDGITTELALPNSLRKEWRNKSLLSTITLAEFANLGIEIGASLLPDVMKNDQLIGSIIPVCISFAIANPIHHPFDSDLYEKQGEIFNCVSIISSIEAPTEQVSKEQELAASSILQAIDDGLVDAEFVASKIAPHLNGVSLMLIQKLLNLRLTAVSNVICACAPVAISFDNDGNFAAGLLKACKRVYSIYCKILINYAKTMSDIMSTEHRYFSGLLGKLKEITIKLLSTIQEKTKVGNSNKALTETKIDSHGRIASYLVFEFEKCESLLLKLSGKLKSLKLLEESKFIQDQINVTSLYDFRIGDIDGARERAKRKSGTKSSASKSKRRKVKKEENTKDELNASDDENSVDDTTSLADSVAAESNDGDSSEGGINLSLNIDDSESDSDDSTS